MCVCAGYCVTSVSLRMCMYARVRVYACMCVYVWLTAQDITSISFTRAGFAAETLMEEYSYCHNVFAFKGREIRDSGWNDP